MWNSRSTTWLIFGLGAIFIAASLIFLPPSLNPDVAWLLYMSQETMAGQTPYVDLFEINPPLIVWLGMLPAWFADISGISIGLVFTLLVLMVVALSLAMTAKILAPAKLPFFNVFLLSACYALVILPAANFGEREHLMLVLAMPYFALVAARVRKLKTATWLVIISSVLAAVGFCIKPHFVLIPTVLELYVLANLGLLTFRRLEPYIMLVFGLLYLASIFLFTPDYISTVIGYASEVYNVGYGQNTTDVIVRTLPLAFILVFTLLLMLIRRYNPAKLPPEMLVLSLAIIATAITYLVQFKGWPNHFYPTAALSLMLIFCSAYLVVSAGKKDAFAVIMVVLFAFPTYIFAFQPHHRASFPSDAADELRPLFDEYPEMKSVYVMSYGLCLCFQIIPENGLTWGSRFPALWLVPGVKAKRADGYSSARLDEIEAFSFRAVAEDIARYQPQLVLVDKGHETETSPALVRDHSKDIIFVKEWSRYRFTKNHGDYAVYVRLPKSE